MTEKIEIQNKVDDVTKAVAAITETEAGIAELRDKYEGVVFDCANSKEMVSAKVARREIREPRYVIETLRKAAKAPVLELGRSLDAIAKDLTAQILSIETPIDDQIKVEEKRIADEKQELVNTENERIASITNRIAKFSEDVDKVVNTNRTAENIAKCVAAYKKKPVDDSFDEFKDEAETAWQSNLNRLEEYLTAVTEREAEDARIKAEIAEQQRIAAENTARQKELDDQQHKLDEQAKAQREEQERHDREVREERERKETKRQVELDKQAAAQKKKDAEQAAEQKKIDDENARLAREEADRNATRKAEEKAEKDKKAAAEAAAKKAVYPGDDAIVAAIIMHFGVPKEVANKWLGHIKETGQ